MEGIYHWGIDFVIFLQGLGDWLVPPMIFFTTLGIEEFYLLVVPVLYWCINPNIGIRTGIMLLLSGSTNNIMKWIFQQPRPYWVSTDVNPALAETSFGLPSGHAQNAVAIWGIMANSFKNIWGWLGAILLMVLIGISRPILGVHFPQDTLLGWIVGFVLLILVSRLEPKMLNWLKTKNDGYKIAFFGSVSAALLIISALFNFPLRNWSMPSSWEQNILAAFPSEEVPTPQSFSSQVSLAGVFFGLVFGHTLLVRNFIFSVKGKWWHLIFRYFLGALGVLAIWFGLDQIFPEGETFIPFVFRYLRYFLVGLWVTYFAPILFIWLRLANHNKP
jgi:membrane-associated phospholipid phosphatase